MATITYKCPNCGGGLQFDPESQKFKCEYCISEFTEEVLQKAADADTTLVYTCPSCGAEIVTDETTAATFCYYCHNPVVLGGKLDGKFAPDYVLPFKINKEKATEIFLGWIRKKKYIPKDFFSEKQIEMLSGIYFPYWLYDCKVRGELSGVGTRIRTWRSGQTEYTERKQFAIERDGDMAVNHIGRNALQKANKKLVESVFPYQMEELKEFSMGYLSGFQAEKRDMEHDQFEEEVEQEVKEFATSRLKDSVTQYNSVNYTKETADIHSAKWSYGLLPVWVLTYRRPNDEKVYYFALNGQTGKICGELPVDKGRLRSLFAKIFFPIFIILLIVGYFV